MSRSPLSRSFVLTITAVLVVATATGCTGGMTDPADAATAGVEADADPDPVYACDGYGALTRYNTVESNAQDVYNWYDYPPATVGNGHGDIDWTLDPHENLGWKLWLSSLRWLGPSIEAGREGDDEALAKAETVITDWIKDHGESWLDDSDHMEANTHRLNVLVCFREVLMERNGGELPPGYEWLTESLHRHARHNMARWSGAHNHGSMENKALLGLGCLLGREDYQQAAIDRVEQALPLQISEEGLSNEAAPHYMHFNFRLLSAIDELMVRCGHEPGEFTSQLTLMGDNLAHMTNSLGEYWQYGNSPHIPAQENATDEALYAATDGQRGTRPQDRVKVFESGFVFGRSSWGAPETGFADEASWMLRGGTGREVKAHPGDLLQFLYTAQGRNILVDGGHAGNDPEKWQDWARGPAAHNTIHVPTADLSEGGPATVTRSEFPDDGRGDFVEMTQRFTDRGDRTRGVLVMTDPDIAVVLDRTEIDDPDRRHTVQTLWNMPAGQTTEVVDAATVRSSTPDSRRQTTFVQVPFGDASAGETIVYRGEEDTQDGIPRGFYYEKEQVRVPSDQVVFSREGNRVGTISVITPALKSQQVDVAHSVDADGGTRLTIDVGDTVTQVRITAGGYMSRAG
jgi:hypothetical protein